MTMAITKGADPIFFNIDQFRRGFSFINKQGVDILQKQTNPVMIMGFHEKE